MFLGAGIAEPFESVPWLCTPAAFSRGDLLGSSQAILYNGIHFNLDSKVRQVSTVLD
jgi:hypothetical protein